MKRLKWLAMFGLMAILLTVVADDALAQRRGSQARGVPAGFQPYFELSATYGSMWGGNMDIYSGLNYYKLRTGTGGSIGIALDYNIHPMQAIELSYTRQDGSLDLDYRGITTLTDMSVNVWHIGSVRYLAPGKVKPFVLGSLGATYFSPSAATFELGGETVYTQTTTKFSFNLGLGIKSYFGEAEKIGIRATFKVMPTFYNTWGGMYLGSGGSGVTFSGDAIWQWEVAGGLTVKFGT